LKQDTRFL